MTAAAPRPRPCASCPYRRDVPSGIWHPDEYEKLPLYDAPTYDQPQAVFMCHHADGAVCAGWLGHADPDELLAVRLGLAQGTLAPECVTYTTSVPLHGSGAEAAAHGLRDVEAPAPKAVAAMRKLDRIRGRS